MIIDNCELWYVKLNPEKPEKSRDKDKPDYWTLQIRTTDKAVRDEWKEKNLNPKPVVPDEGEPYFKVNIRRKTVNASGKEADCPDLIDGNLNPIDPDTVGNGSVGNVRIFQYDYQNEFGTGIASVLMGCQLTKHILYTPQVGEEFAKATTEVVTPETKAMPEDEEDEY